MEASIILQVSILLVGLYLAFFKSYLTEKGKSAALKEDIAELTNEVEGIKSNYLREHELLKTELQRVLSNEVSYHQEARNALVTFFETVSQWKYAILEILVHSYGRTNIDELVMDRKTIGSYYAKTGVAQSKVSLFVEDKELVKNAHDLFSATLDFHHWTDTVYLKIQQNCESQKWGFELFKAALTEPDRKFARDLAEDEKKLKGTLDEICKNYLENRNTESAKMFPFEHAFSEKVKEYLKK